MGGLDVDEVVEVLSRAEGCLAGGCHLGVVGDDDGPAEPTSQFFSGLKLTQSRKIVGARSTRVRVSTGPGMPTAMPIHRGPPPRATIGTTSDYQQSLGTGVGGGAVIAVIASVLSSPPAAEAPGSGGS